jgi:hypothetical protein
MTKAITGTVKNHVESMQDWRIGRIGGYVFRGHARVATSLLALTCGTLAMWFKL